MREVVFIILSLVSPGLPFSNVKIEPDAEFHEKGKSLIVKCDATSISKFPLLTYNYKNSNYTLKRILNSNKYIYIGNLTITNSDQFKVNILCINNENLEFISSKIYFFGYSPSLVLQGNSTPILTCQDFSLQRIICCFKPTENELAKKMGIVEEHKGNLSITLDTSGLDPNSSELKHNNSCFNIASYPVRPSLKFSLLISNILGHKTFDFSFNRREILKPEKPDVYLRSDGNDKITIDIKLRDDGEFVINYTCSSSIHPITQTNNLMVIGTDARIKLGGWKPNTEISCFVQSRIILGVESTGNRSEIGIGRIRMPEGIPNSGPLLSPALTTYEFTNAGYLENVVIYFPDLPLTEQNGDIIKYQWHCYDCIYKSMNVSNSIQDAKRNVRNIILNKARLSSSISFAACTAVGCYWSKLNFQTLAETRPQNRVFLIHDSGNKKAMNVVWYLQNEASQYRGNLPNKILKPVLVYCYLVDSSSSLEASDNECTSIKIIELTSSLGGRKSFIIEDSSKAKFAVISSLSGMEFSKIQWDTCIYNDVLIFEVEKKLLELKVDYFIKFEIKCDWYSCTIYAKVKLPSCQDFPVRAVTGILISYDSRVGRKNSTGSLLSGTSFVLELTEIDLKSTYQSNISIIDYNNEKIFWFSRQHTTSQMTIFNLILIILVIVLIVIGGLFALVYGLKSIKERLFGDKDVQHKNLMNCGSTRDSTKPISLNNVDNHFYNFTNGGPYRHLESLGSPERTDSVKVTSSGSFTYGGSTDRSTASSDLTSSYVSRPGKLLDCFEQWPASVQENLNCNELQEIYAHVLVPDSKGTEQNINSLRLNGDLRV